MQPPAPRIARAGACYRNLQHRKITTSYVDNKINSLIFGKTRTRANKNEQAGFVICYFFVLLLLDG